MRLAFWLAFAAFYAAYWIWWRRPATVWARRQSVWVKMLLLAFAGFLFIDAADRLGGLLGWAS